MKQPFYSPRLNHIADIGGKNVWNRSALEADGYERQVTGSPI
jgi:hypothetical protein